MKETQYHHVMCVIFDCVHGAGAAMITLSLPRRRDLSHGLSRYHQLNQSQADLDPLVSVAEPIRSTCKYWERLLDQCQERHHTQ